ncbi:MAG TPA: DNA primase [Terriglobia bacterium]|nr:DNA primase [Terriglobia bacterium]
MKDSEEVRNSVDIVRIVGDYVQLRKAGVNFKGLCPFHQEKTPSFNVHPQKQIFHCFGCGVGGDVFKFVMMIESVSFPEALKRVAEKAGIKLKERPTDPVSDAAARDREVLTRMHETAARFFASQLSGTAEGRAARAYLADRGLSEEIVARFRIGYAPSEGHALLRHLESSGISGGLLEKSGLVLAESEGRRRLDRFRQRVMFPIARESGAVVAFGGRALGDDQPKYLNSPETPIYTKSRVLYHLDGAANAIRKGDEAILVEGYMDAIAAASAGFEQVVASCGTSLTPNQVRLLARYTRRVVVNYDPDSAGVAATGRSLELLLDEGFECRVLALPDRLDPDAFIRKRGATEYGERLKTAPSYLEYLADQAAAAHDLRTPEGKIAAANAVLPHIARLPNPLLRSEWADRLAGRLHLDDRLLRDEVRRAAAGARRQVTASATAASLAASPAEKELLRGCLENAELADEFLPALTEEGALQGLAASRIFEAILNARARGEAIETAAIEEALNEGEKRLLYECQFGEGPTLSRESALPCAQALRQKKWQREITEVRAAMAQAERNQDDARVTELSVKWKQLQVLTAVKRETSTGRTKG